MSPLEKTLRAREEQVRELQARLARSREKVENLGKRLGKVNGWVEGVERGEREWGGRLRMRLRVLAWLLVGVVVLMVLHGGWGFASGGDGHLGGSGVRLGGSSVRLGGHGGGGGGDVMRKRWNSMNLGAERAMSQGKDDSGSSTRSIPVMPRAGWQVARGRDDDEGWGVMRKRWNNMNLEAERAVSRAKGGSSTQTVTPSVEWQVAQGADDDEDPRLRVFDEL